MILAIVLIGCQSNSDPIKDEDDNLEEEIEENEREGLTLNEETGNVQSEILVQKVSTKTVERKIEGMDEEVQVNRYQILPYRISYQIDETFGIPDIRQNELIHSAQNDEYMITLSVIEHTDLNQVITNLQEELEIEKYEEKSELESIPPGENDWSGKMQNIHDPVKGFYTYEVDDFVLAITYEYPIESGDGMYPLLESLRKSLKLE